jgi:hypothetical protein
MIEHFRRTQSAEPTAATIGINRAEWFAHKPAMSRQEVLNTMLDKRYDIVPIERKTGEVEQYFVFDNDGSLKIQKIDFGKDTAYYLLHVADLIKLMIKNDKTHYFLVSYKDEKSILGLVSLSNFNCKEFYIYMYGLISYVEMELARLLQNFSEKEAFKILDKYALNNDELTLQLSNVNDRLDKDRYNNNETSYLDYLYLNQLLFIVSQSDYLNNMEYRKADDLLVGTGILRDVRNIIAHPVKSLVSNMEDLANLYVALNKIYEIKAKLEKINHG